MCAYKFHTILVKDKYKMAAICFFLICNFVIDFFYVTLHRNNGHQAKLKLFFKKTFIFILYKN